MKKPRRLAPIAFAAALVLAGAPARAALPDSGMADTAPAPPAVGPAVERPLPAPPSGPSAAARPGSPERRKARAAAKRPTPARAAAKKTPGERIERDG
jgi:hypothetical protein